MESGTGTIMDIILLGIILLSTILGARKGFAMTVVSFMQWFVCVICGFIFCDKVKNLLMDYTETDDYINAAVMDRIQTTIEESSTYRALPDLFSGWINHGTEDFSYGTAAAITDTLMAVIAFLVIVFGIKAAGFIIVHFLSRRYNDGVTGFVDGFLGFLFGIARGLILALLFFAVLVPVLGILLPDLSDAIIKSVDNSRLACIFYDGNVLLVLLRDFFS